jgi:hypothetical protein
MDDGRAVDIREAMREQPHVLCERCEAVLTLASAVASPRGERPSEAVDLVRWLAGMRHDGGYCQLNFSPCCYKEVMERVSLAA